MGNEMKTVFRETFDTRRGDAPGMWMIERNSDLKATALRFEPEKVIELLSAGNKYLPIIPDLKDFSLKFRCGINYEMAKEFAVIVSFHYDMAMRRGEAVRVNCHPQEGTMSFEYGEMKANVFLPKEEIQREMPKEFLNCEFEIGLDVLGKTLKASCAGNGGTVEAGFETPEAVSGKIALSRMHFFDVLKIYSFEIQSDDEIKPVSERKFTVPLPESPTLYPINCDFALLEYKDFIETQLSFRGGVAETEPGEGNYHVLRADMMSNPYVKVITADGIDKVVVLEGDIINVVKHLAPDFFYKSLHRKYPWPLERIARFSKPECGYDFAVGFDSYLHSTRMDQAERPSETIFDKDGKVLYSGLGITERTRVQLKSNENKQMEAFLPKDDPRYDMAKAFLKGNHYFIEGESADFVIELTGPRPLPTRYSVILEDAYFDEIKQLRHEDTLEKFECGVAGMIDRMVIRVESVGNLKPGVYHIRLESEDKTVGTISFRRPFEVMSATPGAWPPPPIVSGYPFLYNSRTETRGLITDGFDVWNGEDVPEGHYIACANFLPKAAHDFQVGPTVHAYGRKYFCWISKRCCLPEKATADAHTDLLPWTDYLNTQDELNRVNLTWRYAYKGELMDAYIEFAKSLNDPNIDLALLEEERHERPGVRPGIDDYTFKYIASHYWEQWLDYANMAFRKKQSKFLEWARQYNPKMLLGMYGPAHIYASHYKGPEFVRYLQNEYATPEDGVELMQYEDYPFSCGYGLERGTYFMASCMMALPGTLICPEIYVGGGYQGCPDGAVYYAHPPFGKGNPSLPIRMKRQTLNFALASVYHDGERFRYWEKCGFQACKFTQPWYESLIKAWKIVRDNPPKRPLRCAAYVSSDASRRAHKTLVQDTPVWTIIDVRTPSTEEVPFAYEMACSHQMNAGFQIDMKNLSALTPNEIDVLVLPPLNGVPQEQLEEVRRLHSQGVSLLAFEDVATLEDIFGVRDTGVSTPVKKLSATEAFIQECSSGVKLDAYTEFCEQPECSGHYACVDAEVLIDAEIPVLTRKKNGNATACFFNVPPQLVREDQLTERFGLSKQSISELVNSATAAVIVQMSEPPVSVSEGRLIAFESMKGDKVVIVSNPDDFNGISPEVTLSRKCFGGVSSDSIHCDCPLEVLADDANELRLRVGIPKGDAAVIIIN